MARYFVKRLLMAILTLWLILTATFIMMKSIPGDPFANEKMILPEIRANMEAKYGLDKPLFEQYITYMNNLLHGDFGISFKYKGRSVNEIIATGFPVSAALGLSACAVGLALGIIFGILAAVKRGKWPDYLVIIISILGVSVPAFVFGSLFQYVFAVKLKWFPVAGWGTFAAFVLPTLALGLRMIAYIARMMRTSMLDVMSQDYIKTAKAKGLSGMSIIWKHAFRNAVMPIITVSGSMIASTMVGSFVMENIFNIPGMGKYLVNAVKDSDYTMIMGMTAFYAIIMIVTMLLVDVVYMLVDPRVKMD
ncbi:MAG: ABC transporter permease [Clostridia bacterium]|nr:ABC transporter permease [Clostridia bacterium]